MNHQTIIVLDFGGQYNQLIARRVRECGVYCEVKPYTTPLADLLAMKPIGFIFTGGPNSVYLEDAPHVDPALFDAGVPVLGICYGCQLIAHHLGGKVVAANDATAREYGKTETFFDTNCKLFKGLPEKSVTWMSHGDYMEKVPEGFSLVAHSDACPNVAICDETRGFYGVQYHPEVNHTEFGTAMIRNFLYEVCGATGDWTMGDYKNTAIAAVREKVGSGRVLLALSGGVDSSVVAALLFTVIGILFVRLTQMTKCAEMDKLLVPWDVKWLRAATGVIGALFLFFVVVSMSAGVGAMLTQLFRVPTWLGSAVFMLAVFLVALLGVSGMVNAFSAMIPILVLATVGFAVGAWCTFGTEGILQLQYTNTNPLMPNWFIATLTFVAYNILGGIGIMSPVGQYVREKKHVYVGIALSGVMLLAVAGSILTSLGTYPEAVQAELPMVALASRLNGTLGTIYGIMLLVAMFCNALASLVGMSAYVEQKSAFVRTHKNPVLLAVSVLAWAASLLGFAEIIGTVYPIFGYISIAFLVFLVIHFFRAKKTKQPQQA